MKTILNDYGRFALVSSVLLMLLFIFSAYLSLFCTAIASALVGFALLIIARARP